MRLDLQAGIKFTVGMLPDHENILVVGQVGLDSSPEWAEPQALKINCYKPHPDRKRPYSSVDCAAQ
jgi:hypothetical protein